MQFYKRRDFSELISDTFSFFKENGRNYFRNYLLINGLLLILLAVLFIFGYRELFSQIGGDTTGGESYYFQVYFEENRPFLILAIATVFVLFLATTIISYSYPVLYMKRLSETGERNIKADDILSDIRQNAGRFLLFFLGMLFIVTPVAALIFAISYQLLAVVIGFFLMLLLMPFVLNVVNFLLFDYFHTRKGFFDSLAYALRAQFSYPNGREKSPFWKYWGSVMVNYLIINVITSIFTMIPMIIILLRVFAVADQGGDNNIQNPLEGAMGILFFAVYGISILVSFLLMNFLFVNAGFMYYDSRTDLHRRLDLSEIDAIGSNES